MMSVFNEKLLMAWYERDIPDSDLIELTDPLDNLDGEERIDYQNRLADYITEKYPLRKDIQISHKTEQ